MTTVAIGADREVGARHASPSAADLARAHAVARRLLGCDHLAADAVQEALIALWRTPDAPPALRGWLLRAVVLRARHLRRSLRRRRKHEHAASQHCSGHEGCDNPWHVAAAHELGERLDAARAALPTGQRRLLELAVGSDLDYQGLAAQLDVPVGTVRSRLSRARDSLRRAMPPDPATN